ncbi:Hsp70 family protein [Streptomyces sp. CAI 127]|uniref:caspase, EACC1-associated type n=1 Tax=Streptomyces sp. CAI 127 TaxID=1076397 RepID=UPI001586FE35|nr:Hsp70 family protein [Streptomyces sp. CAI 127]NUW05184.1 Hsp70 family protein [Streptomyces sp. CAI 127]
MARRALIIANSTYDDDHFAALPAAATDAEQLAEVLGARDIGDFEVVKRVDVEQRSALRALEDFFTKAGPDDILLLHLSLHGVKDLRNRLHFVMRDTERDYLSTAVSADTVLTWMDDSRSRSMVVMLDCCYSGAFTRNALRRDAGALGADIVGQFAGRGRAVLTASTAFQYAHEGDQNVGRNWSSIFTSAVVQGLQDGSADLDGDGRVSVDELFRYVEKQVRQSIVGQTPTFTVNDARGTIFVARSPGHADGDRLTAMRSAVVAPQPWKRIGALHLVEQLLGSVREPIRDTARAALLGLIADQEREVAGKARELWHSRGLGEIPKARSQRPVRPAPLQRDEDNQRHAVGIDFGTTNSAIGVFEGDDVRLIPNAEGSLITPSLVAITAEGEILVGTAAKRQAITNPDYTVRSAKLRLGTGWSITRGSVRLTAEDIAARILGRLRADAEAYIGCPPAVAVLTVPANFDLAQRAALVEAARRAELTVDRVINEPTAAAVTYGMNKEADATVLVFDLGGGTLDVSLIRVGDGVVQVRATGGDSHLGGDDWDRRIVQHLLQRVKDQHGVDLADDVPAMQRLLEASEAAKIELTSATTTTVTLPSLASGPHGSLDLEETLTRQAFETLTRDLLTRCTRPVEQAIHDAGIPLAELDKVILTGGATRMPAVGELIRHLTKGKTPYRGLIPEGIVTGATLQSGILAGAVKDLLLLDVVSTSLLVETHARTFKEVIKRNTSIPMWREESIYFAPCVDNQDTMIIHLLEGEATRSSGNRSLAVLELSGLPPHPRRTPLIQVSVDVDANSLVRMTAKELKPGPPVPPTRREWTVIVNRDSMEQASTLVNSPRWPTLRNLIPLACEAPEPKPEEPPPIEFRPSPHGPIGFRPPPRTD